MKKVMSVRGYYGRAKVLGYLLLLAAVLYFLMNVFDIIAVTETI